MMGCLGRGGGGVSRGYRERRGQGDSRPWSGDWWRGPGQLLLGQILREGSGCGEADALVL